MRCCPEESTFRLYSSTQVTLTMTVLLVSTRAHSGAGVCHNHILIWIQESVLLKGALEILRYLPHPADSYNSCYLEWKMKVSENCTRREVPKEISRTKAVAIGLWAIWQIRVILLFSASSAIGHVTETTSVISLTLVFKNADKTLYHSQRDKRQLEGKER